MLGRWCCVWPPPWPRLPVGAKPYNFSPWSPERPPPLPESRRLLIEESCRFRASRTCVCLGTISRGEAMFLIAVILLRTLKSSKSHSYSCRTLDLYPRISLSTHYRRIRGCPDLIDFPSVEAYGCRESAIPPHSFGGSGARRN